MSHLLYQNPNTDVSRFDWEEEGNINLRQSVSVGMLVEASASSAPAGDEKTMLLETTTDITTELYYKVPVNGILDIQFKDVPSADPVAYTPISTYCNSFNLMGTYANGQGGEFIMLVKENDTTTCGYPVDSTKLDIMHESRIVVTPGTPRVLGIELIGSVDVPVTFSFEELFPYFWGSNPLSYTVDVGSGPTAIGDAGTFTLPANATTLVITCSTAVSSYNQYDVLRGVTLKIKPTVNADRVVIKELYCRVILGQI